MLVGYARGSTPDQQPICTVMRCNRRTGSRFFRMGCAVPGSTAHGARRHCPGVLPLGDALVHSRPAAGPSGRALAITQAYATFDLVVQHTIFGHEVLIASQQFLIDRSSDRRQQMLPVHRLPPQLLPSLLTLSMGKREAEDKPKHRRW